MQHAPTELWRWDAVDLASGIKAGTISAREAVASCLKRIEEVNPVLNAVVLTLADQALNAADAADRAVRRGDTPGVLHGVPVTTKLNIDQEGLPNSSGVVAFQNRIATGDNAVVSNLKKAGAIIIGRTNTPPFCIRWMSENELHGRTLSPWSRDHVPGGSTGGGSAAVAAGMGPIAQGSDMGGSIRYPAFCTGVVGLRPTVGRVPYHNPSQFERPLSFQLMSVAGPITRRVRDARLSLQAMAMADASDPLHIPMPLDGPPMAKPIRVAVCRDPIGQGVHSSVAESLTAAADTLAAAGYIIEYPQLPNIVEAAELWDHICQGETQMFGKDMIAEFSDAPMKVALRFMMARIPEFDAEGFHALFTRRATILRQWSTFMQRYPVILAPVSTRPQFIHGEDIWSQEANDESYRVQSVLTASSLVGMPGVAVPTGVTQGLPTGVLVMAPHFREDIALDAAEIIESAFPMPTPTDMRF
jgi:amidase